MNPAGFYHRVGKATVGIAILGVVLFSAYYVLRAFVPGMEFVGSVRSPNGEFVAVVLQEPWTDDAYFIYVFPAIDAPADPELRSKVPYWGKWRSEYYLVYGGYSFPGFHWTGPNSMVVHISPEPWGFGEFHAFKRFGAKFVAASLEFGQCDDRDVTPYDLMNPSENRPNQRPEGTPGKRPFCQQSLVPVVPHP